MSFFGWLVFFTKTQGFLWEINTISASVHLGTERWAHKGRQILILSALATIKFFYKFIDAHYKGKPFVHLCFFTRLGITRCMQKHNILGLYSQRWFCSLQPPTHLPYHGIKILPAMDTLVIHRHTFNCLLLSQHKENHTKS